MAETGWLKPTLNNQDNGVFATVTTPENAQVDDANSAICGGSGLLNHAVAFWHGFDFAGAGLTADATIDGVQLRIRGKDLNSDGGTFIVGAGLRADASDVWADYTNRLRVPADPGEFGAVATYTEGSATSITWGDITTAPEFLSASFRLGMELGGNDNWPQDCAVELIEMNVFFTPVGGGGLMPLLQNGNLGNDLFDGTLL